MVKVFRPRSQVVKQLPAASGPSDSEGPLNISESILDQIRDSPEWIYAIHYKYQHKVHHEEHLQALNKYSQVLITNPSRIT